MKSRTMIRVVACAMLVLLDTPSLHARNLAYRWTNVAIGGGDFVTGLVFHPTAKDVLYARTDIGGAYRWNAAQQRWEPLLDSLGAEDQGRFGVESLALDPSDADRV